MRRTPFATTFAWIALSLVSTSAFAEPPTAASAPKDDARMNWWRDARFGMFIHWGLYAIPAGEWNGATHHGEWIRESAQIPVEKYEEFKKQWNPVKFDANAWASLAKEAGVRYVVITSKHHDGFCLFDSKQTDWDVMDTPFHRDILKELSTAVRSQGLTMCWYHSIMDWHHPDYLPRRSWEKRSTEGADFGRYVNYLHSQVEELLTNYGPIGVMWFDGEWEGTWNHELGQSLYDECRKLQPNVIVNNRVDKGRAGMAGMTVDSLYAGDYGTPEQEIPGRGLPGVDWETCMTMNDHWGYNKRDKNFKSSRELIRMLVDIASKGGNYLLNVGPTADGQIPEESIERLKAMGRWMKVNGTAIYGTQASPFEKVSFGRCTQKKDGANTHLYLEVFDWPADGKLVLEGLGNAPVHARLLAKPDVDLPIAKSDSAITITLGEAGGAPADADCSVVDLVVGGDPIVYEAPRIVAPADAFVSAIDVVIQTNSPSLEIRYTRDGSNPTKKSEIAKAPIHLTETGTLRAQAFHDGKAVSAIVDKRFEKVQPRPSVNTLESKPGLLGEVYKGKFSKISEFANGKPEQTEEFTNVGIGSHGGQEFFGLRLRGYIEVDADELYRFELTSDDGARLYVDNELVVDLDGLHSTESKVGSIPLSKGPHALRVDYFNQTGGAELALRVGTLTRELAPVPPATLSHPQAR